jgi:hypothetical protein
LARLRRGLPYRCCRPHAIGLRCSKQGERPMAKKAKKQKKAVIKAAVKAAKKAAKKEFKRMDRRGTETKRAAE